MILVAFSLCRCIETNVELGYHDTQHALRTILSDIDLNQEDFMANKLDGFRIDRCGIDLLRIQRIEQGTKPFRLR